MDFPKDRDAPRSFVGRNAARSIAGDELWLRKQRFGAVGRNRGGKLEVLSPPPQVYDGFYSLGRNADGFLHFAGAGARYGPYYDRGRFLVSTGFAEYSGNSLFNYGNGFGSVPSIETIGYVHDFNDKLAPAYTLRQFTTYNGKKFTQAYEVQSVTPFVKPGVDLPYNQTTAVIRPSHVRNGPTGWLTYRSSLGFIQYRTDLGQYTFNYIVDLGDGNPFFGNTLTMEYQLPYEFLPHMLSPRIMFAVGKYMRPLYDQHPETSGGTPLPHPINVHDCPGIEVSFSYDNGENWVMASSIDILSEFTDTILPLPTNFTYPTNELFNTAVKQVSITVAPISNRFAIIYAMVPYYDAGPPYSDPLKAKVKLGIMDNASRTLLETAVLMDGEYQDCSDFMGSIIPVPGGAVFTTQPLGEADPRDNHKVCNFTPDGLGIISYPAMPYPQAAMPGWLMGGIFPVAPGKIGLGVYDGAYSIYESRDNGANWARKGAISTTAPAPHKILGAYNLVDYYIYTQLRQGNAPGPIEPSIPWNGDERYDPPVL